MSETPTLAVNMTEAATPGASREKRVLVVAYHFPPSNAVGARRFEAFCRFLPNFGIRPTVLTVTEAYCEMPEPGMSPPKAEVVRAALAADVFDFYRLSKSRLTRKSSPASAGPPSAGEETRDQHRLRRHLVQFLQWPDPQRPWLRPAVKAGIRLLRERPFDALISTGPPWTCHLIGRRLQRHSRLPWVADFRDPWASQTMHDEPEWRRRRDRRMEGRCVRAAKLVVCNNDVTREDFIAHYPEVESGRFVTITNGFDDAVADGTPDPVRRRPGSPHLLLHLGSVYGNRRIDTLCLAVEWLLQSGRLEPEAVKILFVGQIDDHLRRLAMEQAPNAIQRGAIEFSPAIPRVAVTGLLERADSLLILNGAHPHPVPAKFYEYLPTGKPVLAITGEGALARLMAATGAGICAGPDDPAGIETGLLQIMLMPRRSPDEVRRQWSPVFHYRALSASLAAHIHRLTDVADVRRAWAQGAGGRG